MDSGLYSLAMVAQLHQVAADVGQLQHQFASGKGGCTMDEILLAARGLGMKARRLRLAPAQIEPRVLPAIARSRDGEFFVLARKTQESPDSHYLVHRPGEGRPQQLTESQLAQAWDGDLILLARRNVAGAGGFNIRWFLPVLMKYRAVFAEVLVASFALQLFALATPLFFQVVMDKVLVHQGFTTLNVLAVGFLIVISFEAVIGGLRNYLFSHASNRVDVELGARLFHHLTSLPLAYFEARQVGQTVARVRELDSIRTFITGTALTLVIDLLFTFVFFAVLWFYSPRLCLVVVASLPLYLCLSLLVTPVLRHRLNEKFFHGAANQAFLTEAVTGIQTLKTQALEPQMQRRWEEQLASYVSAAFRAQNLNNIASQIASLISKVTTLMIIWWGAQLVIAGSMTVGQLVAFNMIAARVTAPVLKLVQLWQDFQQAGISLRRLGDVLNTPVEPGLVPGRSTPASLQGAVKFEQVQFRYVADGPRVLNKLDLDIRAGQYIGLVGRSGSGKSTVARLIQCLYSPEGGRVQVDGIDLGMLDTSFLRRSIGVVQQESFLFNRSVRENICLSDPGTVFDQVVQCARIAGAHDFILSLPRGYDTVLGEQGCTLSGGQRQRIAIARALISDPKILILDEATSALDYESERIIQQNMGSIARGRTVIVIAHRLSAVRHCDQIHVLDKGVIVEKGSHDDLLAGKGYYARLYGHQFESCPMQI